MRGLQVLCVVAILVSAACCISPAAMAETDNLQQVWTASTGEAITDVVVIGNGQYIIAISEGESILVYTGDGDLITKINLIIWKEGNNVDPSKWIQTRPILFDLAADGSYYVTVSDDQAVRCYDRNGTSQWVKYPSGLVAGVDISDDGKYVVICSKDGTLLLCDTKGSELWRRPLSGIPTGVAISADNSTVITAYHIRDSSSYTLESYRLDGKTKYYKTFDSVVDLSDERLYDLSRDGSRVIVPADDTIYMLNDIGTIIQGKSYDLIFNTIDLSGDGANLLITSSKSVSKYTAYGSLLWTYPVPSGVYEFPEPKDNASYLVFSTLGGQVIVLDNAGNKVGEKNFGAYTAVSDISEDGRLIVVALDDGTLKLYKNLLVVTGPDGADLSAGNATTSGSIPGTPISGDNQTAGNSTSGSVTGTGGTGGSGTADSSLSGGIMIYLAGFLVICLLAAGGWYLFLRGGRKPRSPVDLKVSNVSCGGDLILPITLSATSRAGKLQGEVFFKGAKIATVDGFGECQVMLDSTVEPGNYTLTVKYTCQTGLQKSQGYVEAAFRVLPEAPELIVTVPRFSFNEGDLAIAKVTVTNVSPEAVSSYGNVIEPGMSHSMDYYPETDTPGSMEKAEFIEYQNKAGKKFRKDFTISYTVEPADGATRWLNPTNFVFISYSSQDQAVADTVRFKLEQAGVRCWIASRDMPKDVQLFETAIIRALQKSLTVVVVFSGNSNGSGHVANELAIALRNCIPTITFLIDDSPMNDLMRQCAASYPPVNAIGPSSEESLEHLAQAVKALISPRQTGDEHPPKAMGKT